MINDKILDEILVELGHDDYVCGTDLIRRGVRKYHGQPLTKELYPELARDVGSTASRVERSMRHSISKAWTRGTFDVQERYFGGSVHPDRGVPTVGEYLARLARLARGEGQE